MTTVIVPGAPVARPGPVREVLPRPPSLTYSGSRTRAYRDWYRKYGSLDNYRAYKRTRLWRAGGARHGRGDDYKHEVDKDPFGTALEDVGRWGYNTTWGIRGRSSSYIAPGTIIRSQDPNRLKHGGAQRRDIVWDGQKWTYHYDKDSTYKPNSTEHFDQVDNRMRDTIGMRNPYDYYSSRGLYAKSRWFNHSRRFGYKVINTSRTPVKRTKAMKRTMRYRRFRPGFFKRDDHY